MRLLARVVEGGLGGCMTRRLIDMVEALFETMGKGEGIILINDGIDRAHNNICMQFLRGFCLWDLGIL